MPITTRLAFGLAGIGALALVGFAAPATAAEAPLAPAKQRVVQAAKGSVAVSASRRTVRQVRVAYDYGRAGYWSTCSHLGCRGYSLLGVSH